MKIAAITITGLAMLAMPAFLIYKNIKKKHEIVDPWRGIVQF